MRFGFHVSIAGGFALVGERATALGCETLQLFTSNPRGWQVSELAEADVSAFRADMKTRGIRPLFGHVPYLPNLAAAGATRRRSLAAIEEQLRRCAVLGLDYLVCHIGKALGQSERAALQQVAINVNEILGRVRGNRVLLLLENTAGMGTEVGYRFEQIASVLSEIEQRSRVGVLLDTAHAFAAGYEWRTKFGIDQTLREFDRTIGLARLYGLHLNDSRSGLGSRKDRHWHIGQGEIGQAGFRLIINHPLLRHLPAVLETPRKDERDDQRNLAMVRSLAE